MAAIIYARHSPRRNAETCASCEAQVEICKQWAEGAHIPVRGVYMDKAISGTEHDRPGLWDAISALRRGDVLLCYRLDRLARNVYLSYIIEQQVKKRGATIRSVAGEGTSDEDTTENRLIRRILQALAEYEREVIAARTRAAMQRHQRNGRRMSAIAPYGYAPDPMNAQRWVPQPDEQATLKRIITLRRAGLSYNAIARAMQAENRQCRGKAWHQQTIKNILKRV